MQQIPSSEIRKQFIQFFEKKDHRFVRSSSVFPADDPTLLFTNAGMNQFKPIFLNREAPKMTRAVNSQKCIRVSGKHNDLEEVGVDNYHHTFFEMLGNWSFGDYYKSEAITWAWELLTDVWKLDKNRLWVTIYQDDNEAGEIWKNQTDVLPERILKFGKKDNFWEMGDTGPCGPCTEIHYYTGDESSNQNPDGVNKLHEYREIWNLVFIQYDRQQDGKLADLPQKHVDTGMGFERIAAIMNGFESNYDTDLFQPIINHIEKLSSKSYDFDEGVPHRVIADHLRMVSFSIADGIMPSNEGRGYVLRRVIRRAARFGRILGFTEPFLYNLVPALTGIMAETFPELEDKQNHITKVIKAEEKSFNNTLDRGLEQFDKICDNVETGQSISGDDAFKLYDTFGFPLDLTQLLARERNVRVDAPGFEKNMEMQKSRARAAGKFQSGEQEEAWNEILQNSSNLFTGYDEIETEVKVTRFRVNGEKIECVLDRTPFYAEAGGQIGDTGTLEGNGFLLEVEDTQKMDSDIVHIGKIKSGDIPRNQTLTARVDTQRRAAIRRNHTATHLLHKALKMVLGDHIQQAGSLVAPDRLRFDLTHYEKISPENLMDIESRVNKIILENIQVDTELMEFEAARKDGAEALFGEKYEDVVRVVHIPGFSKELCGGTHVSRTGDIGLFKIISESSLSAGIRRMEAVTGFESLQRVNQMEESMSSICSFMGIAEQTAVQSVAKMIEENARLKSVVKSGMKKVRTELIHDLMQNAEKIGEISFISETLDKIEDLKEFAGELLDRLTENSVLFLGMVKDYKPIVVCGVTKELTDKIHAGKIVNAVGKKMMGGGGGKPHLATAGGKDPKLLDEAMKSGQAMIKELISNL